MSLALALPGRAYPVSLPAIATVLDVVRAERYDVRPVDWSIDGAPADPEAFVVGRLRAALGDDRPDLLVAKSLSTRAAAHAAEQSWPAIWITPLLEERDVVAGIRANPAPQLLVCGMVDPLHDRAVARELVESGSCEVLELPLLDHALSSTGDGIVSRHDADRIAAATRSFVQGLPR